MAEAAGEPGAGDGPFPFDGGWGEGEGDGGVGNGEAGEVAEFDDADLAGIELLELGEGVVEAFEVDGFRLGMIWDFEIDGEMGGAVASLFGVAVAGAVAEDAAHHLGGGGIEFQAAVEIDRMLLDEAEVGFVDEGGGLEGVAGAFAGKVAGREAAKFGVDERDECLQCGGVAGAPSAEELGDVGVGLRHRVSMCHLRVD